MSDMTIMRKASDLVRPGYDSPERFANFPVWGRKLALFTVLLYVENVHFENNAAVMLDLYTFADTVLYGYDLTKEDRMSVMNQIEAFEYITVH